MEILDLTGKTFGRLTVLERAASRTTPNKTVRTMWKCVCECGNIVERSSQNLRAAKVASCGCYKNEQTSKRMLIDLTGKRFGRLVVVERAENATHGQAKWLCQCDCGGQCEAFSSNLLRGHTTSCGCFQDEERIRVHTKHGYRHTRIYDVFCHIKDRCNNPNNPRYSNYGGRGIKVCPEWEENPVLFYEWAYENGFREDSMYGENTIDRIDNDKGYNPDNCRVVDMETQNNNKRNNVYIEHNGETKTLSQWARYFGISVGKAQKYLSKEKLTIQDLIDKGIVTMPLQ